MTAFTTLRRKRGFNLIEIAIVLAVIGLVIGGIYMAASAVSERRRLDSMKNDLITIVSAVRSAYFSQPQFDAPDYATAKALRLFPATITDTGSGFTNPWGGAILFMTAANRQTFGIHLYDVPKSACIDLLTSLFGSSSSTTTALLKTAHVKTYDVHNDHPNGITPGDATTICDTNKNEMIFDYWLH